MISCFCSSDMFCFRGSFFGFRIIRRASLALSLKMSFASLSKQTLYGGNNGLEHTHFLTLIWSIRWNRPHWRHGTRRRNWWWRKCEHRLRLLDQQWRMTMNLNFFIFRLILFKTPVFFESSNHPKKENFDLVICAFTIRNLNRNTENSKMWIASSEI